MTTDGIETLEELKEAGAFECPKPNHPVLFPTGIGQVSDQGEFIPTTEFAAYCRGIELASRQKKPFPGLNRGVSLLNGCKRVRAREEEIVYWSNWDTVIFFDQWGNCTRCVVADGRGSNFWQEEQAIGENRVARLVLRCTRPITDFGCQLHFLPIGRY